MPKAEHPKFEGHVTPNKHEYQKSVISKICLEKKTKKLIQFWSNVWTDVCTYGSMDITETSLMRSTQMSPLNNNNNGICKLQNYGSEMC